MSDTPLPAYVDARKAFSQEASVSGVIGLEKLERVAAGVANDTARIHADLSFTLDGSGRRRIRGVVEASLMLVCQRCLEPVAVDLKERIDLVLVDDEEAANALDKDLDPWIVEDHRIVLADLLDEQLLLGMPIVSYHQSGSCNENSRFEVKDRESDASDEAERRKASSPFAVLADLKIE